MVLRTGVVKQAAVCIPVREVHTLYYSMYRDRVRRVFAQSRRLVIQCMLCGYRTEELDTSSRLDIARAHAEVLHHLTLHALLFRTTLVVVDGEPVIVHGTPESVQYSVYNMFMRGRDKVQAYLPAIRQVVELEDLLDLKVIVNPAEQDVVPTKLASVVEKLLEVLYPLYLAQVIRSVLEHRVRKLGFTEAALRLSICEIIDSMPSAYRRVPIERHVELMERAFSSLRLPFYIEDYVVKPRSVEEIRRFLDLS